MNVWVMGTNPCMCMIKYTSAYNRLLKHGIPHYFFIHSKIALVLIYCGSPVFIHEVLVYVQLYACIRISVKLEIHLIETGIINLLHL